MRRRLAAVASVCLALGFAPIVLAPSAEAAPATVRIVVAPVTAAGHAAHGFSVSSQDLGFGLDCKDAGASPGAVSPNIDLCYPSAAYTPACWKAAKVGQVLCIRDARSHKLFRFDRAGKFKRNPVAPPRDRAPLLIVLTDGDRCQIRIGGAWGQPKGHPNLYGAYSCATHGAAWEYAKGSHSDAHYGIDESGATWRIRTGENNIVWRNIAKAYFVATAA